MTVFFLVLFKLISIYSTGLLVYVLSSWVPPIYNSVIGRTLAKLYEPLFSGIRSIKFIPTSIGMIDFTPIIAILLINLFQRGLVQIAISLGVLH